MNDFTDATLTLPIHEIRNGYFSDIYFWHEKMALEKNNYNPQVTMQIFQKKEAILCGVWEVLEVLKSCCGYYADQEMASGLFSEMLSLKKEKNPSLEIIKEIYQIQLELDRYWHDGFDELEILSLNDGQSISPFEPVLQIKGKASFFAHLETIYLGILARRTKVASNVHKIVNVANDKPILYFPARFDHFNTQKGDGYAAHIGGANAVSTCAQGEYWNGPVKGTIPHALIATCEGDTIWALELFNKTFPDKNLIALVDFDNDCVNSALKCANHFKNKLWGVRLDTSENLVDKSIMSRMGSFRPTGVNPELTFLVRKALDEHGFSEVKIVVSGGFSEKKISNFERIKAPVDAYGVGSFFIQENFDFTADVVKCADKLSAKAGRKFLNNQRLTKVGHLIK